MTEPTDLDVAWFAGLFEGEGCLSRQRPSEGCWRMVIEMSDEDVLLRAQSIFGGRLYKKPRRKASCKDTWAWKIGSQEKINYVVELIYPHMSARRKAKMDEFRDYYSKGIPTMSERIKNYWIARKQNEFGRGDYSEITETT
jgi:hypothetical protein